MQIEYEPWYGVDLDATLAEHFPSKRRYRPGQMPIGKPVPRMVDRINHMLCEGKRVKIFTARAVHGIPETKRIHLWLLNAGLPPLEVTNVKDPGMVELLDDRAVQVEPNTGKLYVKEEKGHE